MCTWQGTQGLAWRASECRQGPVSTLRGSARSGSLVLQLKGAVTSLESGALRCREVRQSVESGALRWRKVRQSVESGALGWREVRQSVAEARRGIQVESAGVRCVAFCVCDREPSWYQVALPPPGVPRLASDPLVLLKRVLVQ